MKGFLGDITNGCRCVNNINPLKTSGDYIYHLLCQLVTLHFVFMGLVWFSV
jgi:hypothetical protein